MQRGRPTTNVRELLGGTLKPSDPRRYLIDAMVAAMSADGHIDEAELAVMGRQITDHPLFDGLPEKTAKTLIEISTDALRFAGGSVGRAPAIAKGLPARIHRLAAYGMAAEVIAADLKIEAGELTFLDALRIALRIAPNEGEEIIHVARKGQLAAYLDDRFLRIKSLVPTAAEVFALRALARSNAEDDSARFKVRDFFLSIPDLAVSSDELDAELYRAFRRKRAYDAQVFTELSRVAATLPSPVDRYWIVVYTLVAEQPSSVPSWRVIPFIGVMQAAFQIVDTDMELAVIDALTFPANLPRPS